MVEEILKLIARSKPFPLVYEVPGGVVLQSRRIGLKYGFGDAELKEILYCQLKLERDSNNPGLAGGLAQKLAGMLGISFMEVQKRLTGYFTDHAFWASGSDERLREVAARVSTARGKRVTGEGMRSCFQGINLGLIIRRPRRGTAAYRASATIDELIECLKAMGLRK
jgi:hypothetical protein